MGTQTTTLQVSYSAVPAVIIVRRDGDQVRITPVPLSWALMWGLLSHWLSDLQAQWVVRTRSMWHRLTFQGKMVKRPVDFQARLIAPFYKIVFGLFAGASWQRSLAWGVLGV